MSKRKSRRKTNAPLVWDCRVCNLQMVGGPRCLQHNPTPEERAANPERYRVEAYAPSYKKAP